MLRVQNLTKWWGDFLAVDDATFAVDAGEVVGFLGPNGAGKSTTMKIITGFVPPSKGVVTVGGHDVAQDSLAARRLIGYLPENTPIYPDMRVQEYLEFRAQLKGVGTRKERASQVGAAMERCLVADMSRRLVGTLSKGYRQRVGLADALLGDPRLIVLDEPTAGMDPNQVREVRKLITSLGEEKDASGAPKRAVLLSTHILSEVEAVCTRAVIIARGQVVAKDDLTALRARAEGGGELFDIEAIPPAEGMEAMLREIPGVKAVTRTPGAAEGAVAYRVEAGERAVRERVARAMLERAWLVKEMRAVTSSLEDIFVRVTAGARAEASHG